MIVVRALPMLPIIALSFLKWSDYSLMFRLVVKYALPPLVANVYLFGFSDWVINNKIKFL
jgi:hypothetical protein